MGRPVTSTSCVLDSWPILEWLKGREPGSTKFGEILQRARAGALELEMSRINYGEVVYSIRKTNQIAHPVDALGIFFALPIRVVSIDDALVDEATELKSRYPFAFAAALAVRSSCPLVTGDSEFRALEADGVIALHWVGR